MRRTILPVILLLLAGFAVYSCLGSGLFVPGAIASYLLLMLSPGAACYLLLEREPRFLELAMAATVLSPVLASIVAVPAMLAGLCDWVILGHSERRASSGSSAGDDAVNRKVRAALDSGLTPIVCVGESLEQREAGATDEFVGGQVGGALRGLEPLLAASLLLFRHGGIGAEVDESAGERQPGQVPDSDRFEQSWLDPDAQQLP